MDYNDLFKVKPVSDYDVKEGKVALVVEEKKPVVYVMGEGKVEGDFYADEVSWIDVKRLAIVGDPNGGEKREIYLFDGALTPILKDNYDNFSPLFIGQDKFYFLSNREGETIHLYLYEGGEITRISKGKEPVSNLCVSSDGRKVAYSQGIYDDDVHLVDVETWDEEVIGFKGSEEVPASSECFTSEGVIFLSNRDNFFDVGEYRGGKISWLRKSSWDKLEALLFNGELAYVEDVVGDFKLILGEREVVSKGYNRELKVDQGYLYFLGSYHDRFTDLYRVGKDGVVERLTDSMQGVSGDFVEPKKVSYESFDGTTIHALLYARGNEDRGVVYIHGGPDWECVNSFSPTIQFLVSKGFKVICPNYRGSTGFGRKFNHMNDGDLGGGDLKDVVFSTKVLGVRKIAITGASYGGYLTMMAVTKYPDIWCRAVAVVPFVNWFTEKQLEREVLKQYDEVKMGNNPDLLRDRSPIFFVDRIKTPLLLLAGENDPRCPAEETLQVVKKLKERGVEIEYTIYKDEGHGFSKIENYVDSIRKTVEFISKCEEENTR
ncbi:MAG: S9 family peptidase [Candidatus Aramenus sp.]|nr:S9 family peptidase [Candidatus Aramenus sp.]